MNAHNPIPNPFVTLALGYAKRGWPVFPCNPQTKRPISEHGHLEATTDPETIRAWWAKSPNAMIGAPTGPRSGFWALDADVDPDKGKDGIAEVAKLGPPLPDTVEQTTPRGGHHKLFRWDDSRPVRNSVSKIAEGVDTRGDGGYIVMAGSEAANGKRYQWAISPENGDILEAPEWLYEEIRKSARTKNDETPITDMGASLFDVEVVTAEAARVLKEQCLIVAATGEGKRNNALNEAAYVVGLRVGMGEMPVGRAREALLWAAGECGLCEDDGADSARKTIASGLTAGAAEGVKRTPGHWHEEVAGEETVEKESIFPVEPPHKPAADLAGTVFEFSTLSEIEPRQFLYGHHYLRRYVSATIAPTKVGKSSLGVVEALAMASGRPLLGMRPTGLWRVRIWNGEDPRDEMTRRISAAMVEHGITQDDIGDRLLVDSGRDMPICTTSVTAGQASIAVPVAGALERALREQRIDVFIVDPFVKSHNVSENDNMAIDKVAREWNRIAETCGVAIDLVHHSRKLNGAEVSIDDARGASALVSAARSARVLARMTKTEGDKLGKSKDYKRYFRFADAVSNMALPAGEDTAWMMLKSVDLHNARFDADGRQTWPSDQVGVVTLSSVVGLGDDLEPSEAHAEAERAALASLANGEWKADSQSRGSWAGVVIAQAYGLDIEGADDKILVKSILKNLIKSGKLATEIRRDPSARRDKVYVRTVDGASSIKSGDLFG